MGFKRIKPYKEAETMSLPVFRTAMHVEKDLFGLGFSFESTQDTEQRWDSYVVTSDCGLYEALPKRNVLIDRTAVEPIAVRRCLPLRLGGLFDEPRFSKDGLERARRGDPSPEKLASRLAKKLRKYVSLPESWQYLFLAVWIVATYLYELFPVFPFLLLMSKHPGCGKSTLLSVLERLCFNANRSFGMTAAGLRRVTDFAPGTLLLDEFEAISKDRMSNTELNEALNSKFDADARVNILVPSEDGNWYPKAFKLFSPLVIAKLAQGGASDTILDRSIIIRMKRLEEGQEIEQEHPRYDTEWADLRDDLYLWALRNWEEVRDTFRDDRDIRIGRNRKADIWRVVLSVGKVLLPPEDFQVLLDQASAPEPSLGEDDLPVEFEPIAEALDSLRADGTERMKATDFKKSIGDKLALHLRGNKAFLEALRFLEDSHHVQVRPWGKGRTAHVYFAPLPEQESRKGDE